MSIIGGSNILCCAHAMKYNSALKKGRRLKTTTRYLFVPSRILCDQVRHNKHRQRCGRVGTHTATGTSDATAMGKGSGNSSTSDIRQMPRRHKNTGPQGTPRLVSLDVPTGGETSQTLTPAELRKRMHSIMDRGVQRAGQRARPETQRKSRAVAAQR